MAVYIKNKQELMIIEMKEACICVGMSSRRLSLSFCAYPGDIVAITGGGEGDESAVLRAILGLQPLAGGYVSVDAEPVLPQTSHLYRRHMSYVPSSLAFGSELVSDIARQVHGCHTKPTDVLSALTYELRMLSVPDDVAGKPFDTLPAPEAQRVAIAVAGSAGRKALILDSPTSAQDEAGRLAVMSYLCSAKMKDVTIVVSTHDPAILSVCNKKVSLKV